MSFLSALLPTVLGAGLAATGVGAPLAALMVGGGYAAANGGNLRKGLMAGLGAYGGAGLASSFGTAGATSAAAPVTPEGTASFTTDTNAYNAFKPTTTNVGAFGEPVVSPTPTTGTPLSNSQYWDTGAPPTETGTRLVGSEGPMNVTAPPAQGGTTFPGESEMQGSSYAQPSTPAAPKPYADMTTSERLSSMGRGATLDNTGSWMSAHPYQAAGIGLSVASGMEKTPTLTQPDKDMGQRYTYSAGEASPLPTPDVPSYEDMMTKQGNFGKMRSYYPSQGYTPISNAAAYDIYHYGTKAADGGLMAAYGAGGNTGVNPVEQMSNDNAIGANTGFPQAYMHSSQFSVPTQTPVSQNVLTGSGDTSVDPYTGEEQVPKDGVPRFGLGGLNIDPNMQTSDGGTIGQMLHDMVAGQTAQKTPKKYTYNPDNQQYQQQMATGGLSDARYNLGGYSDGGRLLRGPGDGVSDSIPAVIGKKQPARLADGEFVVPARIVSELGNGSTEAGARKLYAMMDRIQASRKKSIGKSRVAYNNKTDRHLPA